MKKLLLVPAILALCVSCTNDSNNSKSNNQKSAETTSDWQVTAQVKKTLMAEGSLSASARMISVTTNNGVVTLTGTVVNKEERSKVVKMVKNVSGVSGVNDQLTVSNS